MPHFIYKLKLVDQFQKKENWTNETKAIIAEHFNHLMQLKAEKTVLFAGKTNYDVDHPENEGIVIFEEENADTAKKIMLNDPAIRKGVMTAKLHPFHLAIG